MCLRGADCDQRLNERELARVAAWIPIQALKQVVVGGCQILLSGWFRLRGEVVHRASEKSDIVIVCPTPQVQLQPNQIMRAQRAHHSSAVNCNLLLDTVKAIWR